MSYFKENTLVWFMVARRIEHKEIYVLFRILWYHNYVKAWIMKIVLYLVYFP